MSRNSSGNYTLPAGNPVLSGTTITSTWANSTLSDIQSEMTDSLSRSGKGAMLAPLKIADGTATAPALTWDADPDTGVYRAGAGDVRMQVNATLAQKWTGADVSVPLPFVSSGGATFSGATSFTAQVTSNVGAAGLVLKPATADHVYMEFYARTAAPSTRSGVVGYGIAGTSDLVIANQMTGGNTRIEADGSVVISPQKLEMQGGNPASTTAISNALTAMNVPKAWATLTTTGGGSTVVTVTDGFNVTSAACDTTTIGITFASAFSSTNYAAFASCRTRNIVFACTPSTTAGMALSGVDLSPGTPSPTIGFNFRDSASITLHVVVFGAQ